MRHQWITIPVKAPATVRTNGDMTFWIASVIPNPPAWLVVTTGIKTLRYFNRAGYEGKRTWL